MGPLEKGGGGHSPLVPAEGLHLQGESPVVASRGQPGHESGPVHGAVKGQEVLIPRAVVIVEMESGEAGAIPFQIGLPLSPAEMMAAVVAEAGEGAGQRGQGGVQMGGVAQVFQREDNAAAFGGGLPPAGGGRSPGETAAAGRGRPSDGPPGRGRRRRRSPPGPRQGRRRSGRRRRPGVHRALTPSKGAWAFSTRRPARRASSG